MLKIPFNTFFIFFLLLISLGCSKNRQEVALNSITQIAHNPLQMKGTVLLFWSVECPLCLNYTPEMKNLESLWTDSMVQFVYVLSGNEFKDLEANPTMKREFEDKKVLLDTNLLVTKYFKASVTPQAIVLNEKANVIYSGKIDNWMVTLGQKRQVIDTFYLKDALIALSQNETPKIAHTRPVGCVIQQ